MRKVSRQVMRARIGLVVRPAAVQAALACAAGSAAIRRTPRARSRGLLPRRWCSSVSASADVDAELVAKARVALEADPRFAEALLDGLRPKARKHLYALARAESKAAARGAGENGTERTVEEFQAWLAAKSSPSGVPNVTRQQLRALALFTAVPMVGFGFMDNMIMIIAGDTIESSIGVRFGLSTLCAAGFGNLISDVAGLGLGGYIESSADRLGISNPKLSHAQEATKSARRVKGIANLVGIAVGCLLGMFPLLFIDEELRMLRVVFDELDTGKTGTITRQELHTNLARVGLHVSEQAVADLLDAADIDNTGVLSFDEFRELAAKLKQIQRSTQDTY